MGSLLLLVTFSLLALNVYYVADAAECNGCIILDSKTFDRVLNKFDIMVVKFDKYNPDQTKHAIFEQVFNDLSGLIGMESMIAAHVDVLNNGMITNEELVSRYELQSNIFEEKLPTISIFIRYKNTTNLPEAARHYRGQFADWKELIVDKEWKNITNFNADSLKRSIRELSGIYFTLPGCVDDFDFLAIRFANEFTNFKKGSIIAEAEAKLLQMPKDDSGKSSELYVEWMKQARDSGENTENFLFQETRKIYIELDKSEGVTEEEEKKMRQTLNIFDAFNLAGRFKMVEAPEHDEL